MITFLSKARHKLAVACRQYTGYPMLEDVFGRAGELHRRALLVYLVPPFMSARRGRTERGQHQNWWRNLALGRILDSMGFAVDVVHWTDKRFRPELQYDLMMGTGTAAIRLAAEMLSHTKKLFIATGSEAGFNNRQELQRYADMKARRGVRLKPRRIAPVYSDSLNLFDAIACVGNEHTANTFRPFNPRVFTYNNHREDVEYVPDRDYELARRHFLYLASGGQIHRGLDLLLEAFAEIPDLHLHICAPLHQEKDFRRAYRHELCELPNVHTKGFIRIPGHRFASLCRCCSGIILPSCAEGQPGSVVAGMHGGLIPVVSRECGIDTEDFGITLADCSVKTLTDAFSGFASRPPEWHEAQSHKTCAAALGKFSAAAFDRRWREILTTLLGVA